MREKSILSAVFTRAPVHVSSRKNACRDMWRMWYALIRPAPDTRGHTTCTFFPVSTPCSFFSNPRTFHRHWLHQRFSTVHDIQMMWNFFQNLIAESKAIVRMYAVILCSFERVPNSLSKTFYFRIHWILWYSIEKRYSIYNGWHLSKVIGEWNWWRKWWTFYWEFLLRWFVIT